MMYLIKFSICFLVLSWIFYSLCLATYDAINPSTERALS